MIISIRDFDKNLISENVDILIRTTPYGDLRRQ